MIDKLVIESSYIKLNESTKFPFTYTFSKTGVHKVQIGLENTDEICAFAFKDCKDLTKITFPPIIKNIKRNAFENCSSLKSIEIPETIEYIGPNVFDGCTTLSEITFKSSTPPIFYSKLSSDVITYIPTDSKFIKVEDNSTLVKDGTVQYYERNELNGYDEVDYESLVDDGEYYYDNWTTVHSHLNTIEEKNRIRPTEIGLYEDLYDTTQLVSHLTLYSGSDYTLETNNRRIKISPENCTNKNLYYKFVSNNPDLLTIDSLGNITTKPNSIGSGFVYIYTEPNYSGLSPFTTISIDVNIPHDNTNPQEDDSTNDDSTNDDSTN